MVECKVCGNDHRRDHKDKVCKKCRKEIAIDQSKQPFFEQKTMKDYFSMKQPTLEEFGVK